MQLPVAGPPVVHADELVDEPRRELEAEHESDHLVGCVLAQGDEPRTGHLRDLRKELVNYSLRHSVRTGLTGYAQVHGWRGYTSIEERLRHDLFYVRHWSLFLDLKILMLTLLRGWSERTRNGI